MKSLNQYIEEKLKINKDFKGVTDKLGTWEVVNDINGQIWIASYDANVDEITDELFKNILIRPDMKSADALERFENNKKPILVAFADKDNCDNYVLFGYDRMLFGGKYAMYFINTINNENTKHKMEIFIVYDKMLNDNIIKLIKDFDCWEVQPEEADTILKAYEQIEHLAEYKNR